MHERPLQPVELPKVGPYRLRRQNIPTTVEHQLRDLSVLPEDAGRQAVFRHEHVEPAALRDPALPIAPPGGVLDGVDSRHGAQHYREVDINAGFDELRAHDAAGLAGLQSVSNASGPRSFWATQDV